MEFFRDVPRPDAVCPECGHTEAFFHCTRENDRGEVYDWGTLVTCLRCKTDFCITITKGGVTKMQTLPYRERILKLAKWAQLYIAKLEQDIVALKEERGRVAAGKTPIYWSMFRSDGDHYLPDGAEITFIAGKGLVKVSLHEGKVRVRAYDGALTISPRTTNGIDVVAEKGY